MRATSLGMAVLLVGLVAAAPVHADPGKGGKLVVVKMVDQGGGTYRFDPATVTVQPGDTVRWLEASGAPHNVQFDKWPSGAKLGSSQAGPLLTSKGATYQLVIDGRFPAGTYAYECLPHGMLGMKATLTVAPTAP